MAVTLWKAEYHHLAFLDEVMGSQSSMACSFSVDMLEGAIVSISDGRRHAREERREDAVSSVGHKENIWDLDSR
jgi:hypothetical protein